MLELVVACLVLYIVVRAAARHGVLSGEQIRTERERYEAFEQMIESGNLPDAPRPEKPDTA